MTEEVRHLLAKPKKIVITTHLRPDGDAMGSCLALYAYLSGKNHQVHVISPTEYPEFLKWMPGNSDVLVFEKGKEEFAEIVMKADIIFCLDFNKLYRLEHLGTMIAGSPAIKILIDHHLEPDRFPDFSFWSTAACSTAELVYEFVVSLGDKERIDQTMATCLYAGILTDTDRFRVPTTSAKVHRIVAELMECGIDHNGIYQELYETFSENRLRFLGYCFREKLEVIPGLSTGIIALEYSDLNRFNITMGDTEGLVNYPLWIKTLKVSALLLQRQNEVKISMRSKGTFSVEQICREYFSGGGHRNASGGSSSLTVKETRDQLIHILARFKKELQPV